MLKILLPAVLIVLWLVPSNAEACRRCKRSGRSCQFYGTRYYEPYYVAPKVIYRDRLKYRDRDNVFVIQNNNDYEPLVSQGSTLYQSRGSYSDAALPFLDPNNYFEQEQQLVKAVEQTQNIRSERTNALFARIMEQQGPAVEKLASGQAAKLVLEAAGLNPAYNVRGQQQRAVVITHNDEGQVQVTPLSGDQLLQIRERTETQITTGRTTIGRPQAPSQGGHQGSLLKQYCAKCHGTGQAKPADNLYLWDDPQTIQEMDRNFTRIYVALRGGSMPPASEPQPSAEERQLILDEVATLVASQPAITKEEE